MDILRSRHSFLYMFFFFLRLALLMLAFGIITATGWFFHRSLALPSPVNQSSYAELPHPPGRHIEHVALSAGTLGTIGIAISWPDPLPAEKMPVVMVLGGLDTGENNIRHVGAAGNNVIIGYDWPMPVKPPNGADIILDGPALYKQIMLAPPQIASALDWITAQSWADEKRMSILGYSMGALAAPAAQDETQRIGHTVGWTILAYGGAPLGAIFSADKHIKPDWMRAVLSPVIDVLFHPVEPDIYLPNLTGHFLILEGKNDQLIPEDARARLRNAVPEPKTVVTFEGAHMGVGPDKDALLHEIIETSRSWLMKTNAVNPL